MLTSSINPRAVKRVWQTEKARPAEAGESHWSVDNEVLQFLAITVVLYGALLLAFGWIMVPFLLLQMLWGWFGILTSANYIEHYGLLRQKLDNGRYEPCQPHHLWNFNSRRRDETGQVLCLSGNQQMARTG